MASAADAVSSQLLAFDRPDQDCEEAGGAMVTCRRAPTRSVPDRSSALNASIKRNGNWVCANRVPVTDDLGRHSPAADNRGHCSVIAIV